MGVRGTVTSFVVVRAGQLEVVAAVVVVVVVAVVVAAVVKINSLGGQPVASCNVSRFN